MYRTAVFAVAEMRLILMTEQRSLLLLSLGYLGILFSNVAAQRWMWWTQVRHINLRIEMEMQIIHWEWWIIYTVSHNHSRTHQPSANETPRQDQIQNLNVDKYRLQNALPVKAMMVHTSSTGFSLSYSLWSCFPVSVTVSYCCLPVWFWLGHPKGSCSGRPVTSVRTQW